MKKYNNLKIYLGFSLIMLAAAGCQTTSGTVNNSSMPADKNSQNQKIYQATPSPEPQIPPLQKPNSEAPLQSQGIAVDPKIYLVGNITFHPDKFVNKYVKIAGYIIDRQSGYIIFSDEKVDKPNPHDLPVTGSGIDKILPMHKYLLTGRFVHGGLLANNNNPYHFEIVSISN